MSLEGFPASVSLSLLVCARWLTVVQWKQAPEGRGIESVGQRVERYLSAFS